MDFSVVIVENESIIRASIFIGLLLIMGAWELLLPRKKPTISKTYRWVNNLALVFLNGFITKLILPITLSGMAILAHQNGWGVLNYFEIDTFWSIVIFIIVMDFIIYMQHVMVHALPILWRLHRVHHTDLDYDTSTGARFHTLEILLSFGIKFTAIVLLGPTVLAVILFEIILNVSSMFNHGNVKLPKTLDKYLRYFIVTPDMHRIHHSIEEDETNSNFGFSITIWDRVFGTYKDSAKAGQIDMVIGIKNIREPKDTNMILGMLMIPFKGKNEQYTINSKTKSD
jgi:sterol desaturase/sphingolipid hydroxylase (fatty acid hydroxylase superfamily)